MAMQRPINLNAPGLTYGFNPQQTNMQLPPDLAAALTAKQQQSVQPPPADGAGPGYAIAQALAATPHVQGNSVLEAIGAALQGGLAGREARREHQRELDEQMRTRKQEDNRSLSMADALTAYRSSDPNDPQGQLQAMIGALSGDPQDALPLINQQMEQNAPLTRWQQAQMDDNTAQRDQQGRQFNESQATTRRGQDLDYQASLARTTLGGGGMARLRGPDASQLTRVQQAGESARQLQQFADQFQGANQHTGSGPFGQWTQYFTGDMAAMRQASSLMRGLMRPVGSGATSDYEQRLYAQGAPDPGLPGPANQERINNIRKLAAISNARQFFYEDYADQNGTLRGAEQAFQASEEYRRLAEPPQTATPASAAETAQQPQVRNWTPDRGVH